MRRPTRPATSGVAVIGPGLYALIGTRAPCPCGSDRCRVPYRMTTRDDAGNAAALVRVLDAAGRTVATCATRVEAVARYGRRHLTPADERWT